eukprot:3272635-Amphidinium_carterae.1
MGIMPAVKSCSACGCKVVRTTMRDHTHCFIMRCSNYLCRRRMYRLQEHPFFTRGKTPFVPLARQWQVLQMFMHQNSIVSIRQNTGLGHATIERFVGRIRDHIQEYVFRVQENIVYGDAGRIAQVEVDEVTVRRYASGMKDTP